MAVIRLDLQIDGGPNRQKLLPLRTGSGPIGGLGRLGGINTGQANGDPLDPF